MKEVFFTVYKTTNTVNGKIYIGAHKTRNPNDGYLGSGSALRTAITKYGREAFSKEVLFSFSTEAEMLDKERELVTEEFCDRKDNYNLKVGGRYGVLSEESRERISAAQLKFQGTPEALEANRERGRRRWREDIDWRERFMNAGRAATDTESHKARARNNLARTLAQRVEGIRKSWGSYSPEEREARVHRVAESCRTDSYRTKMSNSVTEALAKPSAKENLSKGILRSWTPERRLEQSEKMKLQHASPENREKRGRAISLAQNKPEVKERMLKRRRRGESREDWLARTGG